MKRIGNLFAEIVEYGNLRLAAYKVSRGKRDRPQIHAFLQNLDANLSVLAERLRGGTIERGRSRPFTMNNPKPRIITVPRSRNGCCTTRSSTSANRISSAG